MGNYPEIRFRYPWLLLKTLDPVLRPAYVEMDKEYVLGEAFLTKRMRRFEELWKPYEQRIIRGMCDTFELEFRQNVIDIYIAPLRNSFSDPMIIAAKVSDERVVEVIAHELLHRLLSDNTISTIDEHAGRWQGLFGQGHSKIVLNHIAVHAGLQALFVDVLHEPERLQRDIDACKGDDYRKAWEYVEEHGYQNIIAKVKESYQR